MDMLELMERRRSIRKYEERQVSKEDLEKILKAGLFAPMLEAGKVRSS